MAKQWKIGTAYVEVEARFKWANTMQQQAQQINAAAAKVGASAAKAAQAAAQATQAQQMHQVKGWPAGVAAWATAAPASPPPGAAPQATSAQKVAQLGLLNMPLPKVDTSKWGIGPPGGYVQEQKAKTFWEKFYKLSGVVGDLATGTWKSYLALGAFAGSVVAATATVANFTQAASPSTMETFSNSVQSAKATIGSSFIEPVTKMSYQVQQFTAQIEESKKASGVTKQWQGFKAWLVLLGLAKGPRGEGLKFDTPARPEFTSIAQAWRQAQMAGAFAQAKPLEMEVLQKQFANLDKLYQVAAEINSKIPTNNLPLNTQRDVISAGSGGEF